MLKSKVNAVSHDFVQSLSPWATKSVQVKVFSQVTILFESFSISPKFQCTQQKYVHSNNITNPKTYVCFNVFTMFLNCIYFCMPSFYSPKYLNITLKRKEETKRKFVFRVYSASYQTYKNHPNRINLGYLIRKILLCACML